MSLDLAPGNGGSGPAPTDGGNDHHGEPGFPRDYQQPAQPSQQPAMSWTGSAPPASVHEAPPAPAAPPPVVVEAPKQVVWSSSPPAPSWQSDETRRDE
jgi:hypothetical protein